MKSVLIILAAFVATVAAQVPERCGAPLEWHSHVIRETREYSTFTFYTGRFAYDGYNERYRFLEGLPDEHEPEYAHYFFFKERYQLRVNFTTRMCMRSYLNETFRPFSIPYDAKYVDTLEIGSNVKPGMGLEVNVWGGKIDEGSYYSMVFTSEAAGCLPVSDDYFREPNYFSTHKFYDVEGGFNPDDFVPPSFCQ